MALVVIQPSLGNPVARRHWADTIERPVSLNRVDGLTEEQRSSLEALHPDGSARFWGTVQTHDRNMNDLQTGDVVLFTGQKHVRAIGEVGVSFRNAAAANSLWAPDPDRGPYHNVYSLRSLSFTEIPYEEIWELPGFNAGDNFMGTRFLRDERVDMLIDALGIHRKTEDEDDAVGEAEVLRKLVAARVIPSEALHTIETTFERQPGTTLVRRSEALLVRAYADACHLERQRTSTPVGLTDLLVTDGPYGGPELVEAKSSTKRRSIREAIGQLLDYGMHSGELASIALLIPERPEASMLAYAHNYGIDVIYPVDDRFERASAPVDTRRRILQMVRATPAG